MLTVNENTTLVMALGFTNEDLAPVVPGASQYRLDDVSPGAEILGWTDFLPEEDTHDLIITAAQNAIINSALAVEKKRLTLKLTYSDDHKEATAQYIYAVKNLAKIP
jgi:hypothetical protein